MAKKSKQKAEAKTKNKAAAKSSSKGKKPSGSNDFLLLHAEKLVLGLAVVLTGVFIWLGYTTPQYKETTPPDLVRQAESAKQFIEKNDAWQKIAEFRKGDKDVDRRVVESSRVAIDTSSYVQGPLLGHKAKAPGLRKDPELRAPVEVATVAFQVPMIIKKTGNQRLAVDTLPLASGETETAGGGGRGDSEGRGGSLGGSGGGDDDDRKRRDEVLFGETLPGVVQQYIPGVRPTFYGLSRDQHTIAIANVVGVYALVEVKNQYAEFKKVFADAAAYYPKRDRPIYQYVEIQRREKGQGDDAWVDVTKRNVDLADRFFPERLKGGAPEVVDPKFWDQVLTGAIPPITMVDYRPYATHPNGKIPFRRLLKNFELIPDDIGAVELDADKLGGDPFSFDSGNADRDTADSGDQGDRDAQGGGRGRQGRGQRPGGRGRPEGGSSEQQTAASANVETGHTMTVYEEMMKKLEPPADYKLVRFYDINVPSGKEFEYRVRVWLADPNNENPAGFDASAAAQRNDKSGGAQAGMAGLEGGEAAGGGGGAEEDDYEYIPLSNEMLDPAVRRRIYEQSRKSPDELPHADLKYARPTEWTAAPAPVAVRPIGGEVAVGSVSPGTLVRVGDADYVQVGDPSAELAVGAWNTEYGTRLVAPRTFRRAEMLDVKPEKRIHVLHPIDWTVRELENPPVVETDEVVVDILGGEKIPISRALMDYNLPGEVLVMDAAGNFRIKNDTEDKVEYHIMLLKDDELAEVGKRKKTEDDNDRGGGGDDFPGN